MITVSFETDNSAFEDDRDREISRILRKIANLIDKGEYHPGHSKSILDVNGNRIGSYKFTED